MLALMQVINSITVETLRLELIVFLTTVAASSNDACELAICTCDSVAAKCFARNWFNPAYEDYPQSKC